MNKVIEKEFQSLTTAERVELVAELWEQIATNPKDLPIPESHVKELEHRRRLYSQNMNRATSWAQTKALILDRHAKRRRPT